MKKIFLVYGHYNDQSFNAAIRDTFIKTAEGKGNKVDAVDLYKEKFDPVFACLLYTSPSPRDRG